MTDCYLLSKYPIPKDKTRGRFTFCWCCNRLYAKWVVCGSSYSVDDPTFLCDRCFRNTHYEAVIESSSSDTSNLIDINISENDETVNGNNVETFEKNNPKLRKLCEFKAYHFSQLV